VNSQEGCMAADCRRRRMQVTSALCSYCWRMGRSKLTATRLGSTRSKIHLRDTEHACPCKRCICLVYGFGASTTRWSFLRQSMLTLVVSIDDVCQVRIWPGRNFSCPQVVHQTLIQAASCCDLSVRCYYCYDDFLAIMGPLSPYQLLNCLYARIV
jgi:hypothetical protein